MLQGLEALVQYRNEVFGHEAGRRASFFERMRLLLLPAVNDVLAADTRSPLRPPGTHLVYVTELQVRAPRTMDIGLRELVGPRRGKAAAPLVAGLTALRRHLLTFAVSGHFTHVSTREALHRYYRLCQDGPDVPHAMTAARQALRDLEAQHTIERQMQVATDMAQNVAATRQLHESMPRLQHDMTEHLGAVAHVQIMVEYIAILLVSVYAAHLWHMIEPHVHWAWLHQEWWIMPHGSWGLLLIALLAGGITAREHDMLHLAHRKAPCPNNPDRRRQEREHHDTAEKGSGDLL